jgi:hypothetical protein
MRRIAVTIAPQALLRRGPASSDERHTTVYALDHILELHSSAVAQDVEARELDEWRIGPESTCSYELHGVSEAPERRLRFREAVAEYHQRPALRHLRVVIGREFRQIDDELQDGARVVYRRGCRPCPLLAVGAAAGRCHRQDE